MSRFYTHLSYCCWSHHSMPSRPQRFSKLMRNISATSASHSSRSSKWQRAILGHPKSLEASSVRFFMNVQQHACTPAHRLPLTHCTHSRVYMPHAEREDVHVPPGLTYIFFVSYMLIVSVVMMNIVGMYSLPAQRCASRFRVRLHGFMGADHSVRAFFVGILHVVLTWSALVAVLLDEFISTVAEEKRASAQEQARKKELEFGIASQVLLTACMVSYLSLTRGRSGGSRVWGGAVGSPARNVDHVLDKRRPLLKNP